MGNKKPVPEGYVDLYTFNYIASGSVLCWNSRTKEGIAFWCCSMYHKVFHIPFDINDITSPDPGQIDLSFALKKGTGLEFEILRKARVILLDLPVAAEDNLKIWNCRVIIDRKDPFIRTETSVNLVSGMEENDLKLKGFLIRKGDVRT